MNLSSWVSSWQEGTYKAQAKIGHIEVKKKRQAVEKDHHRWIIFASLGGWVKSDFGVSLCPIQ